MTGEPEGWDIAGELEGWDIARELEGCDRTGELEGWEMAGRPGVREGPGGKGTLGWGRESAGGGEWP